MTEDFWLRENEGTGRRFTRHQTTLGAGLVPDCSRLSGRERFELYETRLNKEIKMIKYLKKMPDAQSRETGRKRVEHGLDHRINKMGALRRP